MSGCKALALFGQHYWDVRGYNGFRLACLWRGVWLEPPFIKGENKQAAVITSGKKEN